MPPKPPKSIEERVRLEFDRLSLGKMHEMGIQDRVEAIEGTLNSILGYEDKSTGCGKNSPIDIVEDVISKAKTEMNNVLRKNGEHIKLMKEDVASMLLRAESAIGEAKEAVAKFSQLDDEISSLVERNSKEVASALRRVNELEASLESLPSKGLLQAAMNDLQRIAKKLKEKSVQSENAGVLVLREEISNLSFAVALSQEKHKREWSSRSLSSSVDESLKIAQTAAALRRRSFSREKHGGEKDMARF
jgi:hypothetical protein